MELLGYLASFAMGLTLGVLGGGGSILTVPILVYLFSVSPMTATGYSLFVVGLTALVGSSLYFKKGDYDFKVALFFSIPSVLGVNISRGFILPNIPEVLFTLQGFALTKGAFVMAAFATLMIFASYSMLRKKVDQKSVETSARKQISRIVFQGLIVGLIAGFVGAGGGFLIIPALVIFAGLTMRVAVGTSLMIIATQSLIGFAGDFYRGAVIDWSLLGVISAIAVVGIIVGFQVAHKVKEQKLKLAFGWFILFMGTSILLEQIYHFSYK